MPLSGGADVILQELRLDLILEVSQQGSIRLLSQERGEEIMNGRKISGWGEKIGKMTFLQSNHSRVEKTLNSKSFSQRIPSIHQSIHPPLPKKTPRTQTQSRLDTFVNFIIADTLMFSQHATLFSCSSVPRSCS